MGKIEEIPSPTDRVMASGLGSEVTAPGVGGGTLASEVTASGVEPDLVVPGMDGMRLAVVLAEVEVGGSGIVGATVKLDFGATGN